MSFKPVKSPSHSPPYSPVNLPVNSPSHSPVNLPSHSHKNLSKNDVPLKIFGCFFHLCQNWWRRASTLKLLSQVIQDTPFSEIFKLLQSLAYVPEDDVVEGFEYISSFTEHSLKTR